MRIPIVMVSDNNYILQTKVAIWSMRENTCADIFLTIICSSQLNINCRTQLRKLENVVHNLKVNFYEVDDEMFSNVKTIGRIPITSYYRLIIADIIEDQKCIFLDGDIIVNTDLQTLYLENIDGFYIAGVRDNEFLLYPENAIYHYKTYGFNLYTDYINAGVMIFNLSKIREDNLQRIFLDFMKNDYPYMDQDILNKVCEGKIKLLDLEYNFFNSTKKYVVSKNNKIDNAGGINSNILQPKILHFPGAFKPWKNIRIRYANQWWNWAKKALEADEYNQLYSDALNLTIQNDWSYILERSLKEKIIVIIGYSYIGIDVLVSLKRCGITASIFYCDNSLEKQKLSDENIIIYSVEEMASIYPYALWLNTSQRSCREINEQLKRLGIIEERIVIYRKKTEQYFEFLDDEYIEYEIEQIRLKMTGKAKNIGENK